ncbi:hypothetical protein CB1_084759009 [Camelus ferus]|nr:hypothetical protein CB1_084759009 [Camelus ferus]
MVLGLCQLPSPLLELCLHFPATDDAVFQPQAAQRHWASSGAQDSLLDLLSCTHPGRWHTLIAVFARFAEELEHEPVPPYPPRGGAFVWMEITLDPTCRASCALSRELGFFCACMCGRKTSRRRKYAAVQGAFQKMGFNLGSVAGLSESVRWRSRKGREGTVCKSERAGGGGEVACV